jgi:hypothetical protein
LLRDRGSVLSRLREEAGLTEGEAKAYLEALERGRIDTSRREEVEGLLRRGMLILSGDGSAYVPVHPRLAVSNQYRQWREAVVREINERRMRVDRLILELIPLYEAATEKRMKKGGGGEKG